MSVWGVELAFASISYRCLKEDAEGNYLSEMQQ